MHAEKVKVALRLLRLRLRRRSSFVVVVFAVSIAAFTTNEEGRPGCKQDKHSAKPAGTREEKKKSQTQSSALRFLPPQGRRVEACKPPVASWQHPLALLRPPNLRLASCKQPSKPAVDLAAPSSFFSRCPTRKCCGPVTLSFAQVAPGGDKISRFGNSQRPRNKKATPQRAFFIYRHIPARPTPGRARYLRAPASAARCSSCAGRCPSSVSCV